MPRTPPALRAGLLVGFPRISALEMDRSVRPGWADWPWRGGCGDVSRDSLRAVRCGSRKLDLVLRAE